MQSLLPWARKKKPDPPLEGRGQYNQEDRYTGMMPRKLRQSVGLVNKIKRLDCEFCGVGLLTPDPSDHQALDSRPCSADYNRSLANNIIATPLQGFKKAGYSIKHHWDAPEGSRTLILALARDLLYPLSYGRTNTTHTRT